MTLEPCLRHSYVQLQFLQIFGRTENIGQSCDPSLLQVSYLFEAEKQVFLTALTAIIDYKQDYSTGKHASITGQQTYQGMIDTLVKLFKNDILTFSVVYVPQCTSMQWLYMVSLWVRTVSAVYFEC